MWRRSVRSGLRLVTSGLWLGASVNRGTEPLPRAPYVTRGLIIVDRALGANPATCSSRHLTFHLFHSYISSIQSLRPQGLFLLFCTKALSSFLFWCVLGQYRLRAWGSNITRELLASLVAIRVGHRDSHVDASCTHVDCPGLSSIAFVMFNINPNFFSEWLLLSGDIQIKCLMSVNNSVLIIMASTCTRTVLSWVLTRTT